MGHKKQILQAKKLYIQGSTLKEVAEQTGLNESTLRNYSSKEEWKQQQKNFSLYIYNELQNRFLGEHIKRKEKILGYLDLITETTIKKLKAGEISVDKAVNTIMTSIKGQSEILGFIDFKTILEIEALELKRNPKQSNRFNKVSCFLDDLEKFI